MQSSWHRLVGTWTTEGSHPLLPGAEIRGHSTFEWLAGEQFLIWRSHYEHPDIPDAIAVIGLDGSMRYFDSRGLHREYSTELGDGVWQFARDDPGFRQRFTGRFSDGGDVIVGRGEMARDGGDWEGDLALTYRRAGARADTAVLDDAARRVLDANHYMTLATIDPTGRPRLSPVYYTAARYADLYWVSSPDAQHSLNLAASPEIDIVIYDSTAPVSEATAAYISATAGQVPDDMLGSVAEEAFRTTAGAHRFGPEELRASGMRLYVAHVTSCEVHG